jgi:hypothetical protein
MRKEWSHGNIGSTFHETSDFEKTSSENIMIASQRDIRDDTKPRNLSPGTIGGLESKPTSEGTLMDAKPVNQPKHIERRLTTRYIPMRFPMHHGNISRLILLGSYQSLMALMPFW